ncbi:MAG: glycine cleavage system aminomethyltransferase GcvT [Actinobacteria bacterium]|nr:glycine cleavage system aminomethyltransferase GcvT [Actinomycetota bacterium]
MTEGLRTSPLDAAHRALGARMVEFGGWDMPIQYTSVLEEHRACRTDAAVFDVSHLGSVRVQGAGALGLLQWAFTNDLGRIAPGKAQYTHLLDPADAHVVDDIIVWWVADDDFLVMPNASNTARIADALTSDASGATGSVSMGDITHERAILAVQGPQARARIAAAFPEAAAVPRFGVVAVEFEGQPGYAAGTGYTGEDGVELHVPVAVAPAVWDAVVGAGVTPAGLGCRDTLRLEAGLPLHGHELGPGITSLQAGLGWVVRFDKGDFRGREALAAERDRGVARHLVGILTEGRRPARQGSAVLVDGEQVGEVTSGNFSPMLERGIALAFVPPAVDVGAAVSIDVRGSALAGEVVGLPFWPA